MNKFNLIVLFLFVSISTSLALNIELLTPADNAVYDTSMPCVREFLANFDARGVKPPRPPKTEAELKKEREQNEAYFILSEGHEQNVLAIMANALQESNSFHALA